MSNSYITNGARIAGIGRDQGLTDDEIVDGLIELRQRKDRKGVRALDGEDRRAAAVFDFDAAGVPAELGGFGLGNGGEDIEFGVDQADWQVAQGDDKDIVAKKLRRAQQAAADIGFDARMREQGDGARVRRAQAMMELAEERAAYADPGEGQDPRLAARMQNGSNINADPYIVGPRDRQGNLQQVIRKNYIDKEGVDRGERLKRVHGFVDKKGRVREPQKDAQEREPDFPLGFEDPDARNKRMISEIRRERAEANILREASPRVNIAPNADGGLLDPAGIGNLERLGDISDVGNLKAKMPAKAGGFNEGQYFPEAAQDGRNPAFDGNGLPLGVQGPIIENIPNVSNRVNAPQNPVRQWAIENAPNYKEGGRIFGDFPQVDIMGAGDDFLARIGKIKARGQAFDPGISAIRNIDDLEAVVGRFGAFAQEGGLKMFALDTDKNEVYRDQVGLPEIFQKMKMNENGQGRLANALFQLEAAKANGVNNERREQFEQGDAPFGANARFKDLKGLEPAGQVQFGGQAAEFGGDEAQLQKIPRGAIQIGVDAVGEPIKQEKMAALQALSGRQAEPPLDANELRDARNGLVGLVQGEGNGNYGFAKEIPTGADDREYFMEQARDRAKGKPVDIGRVNQNIDRRREIIAKEAAARGAGNQVLGVVGTAERQLQEKGVLFPRGKAAFQGELDEGWRGDPERNQMPGKVIMSPDQIRARRGFSPGAEAAPDAFSMPKSNPIAAQMSAPNQSPLSGISYNESAPDPWQTPPATGAGITQEVVRRNEAKPQLALPYGADSSGPSQGPRTPGIRQKIMNSIERAPINFASAPRRQRYGAAAGAALLGATGISSLIGGERDRRQEEGQY